MAGFIPDERYLLDMLAKILSGQVQCWSGVKETDKGLKVGAFIFTTIIKDELQGEKNLLLIGVFVFDFEGFEFWREGFKSLAKYAAANKCQNIVFYTDVPKLVEIAGKCGSLQTYTFGKFKIPK
jgi:hypothetical protein